MKLSNIALYSNDSEIASFSFRDPGGVNPYIIKGITGLDADEIVPKFYGVSSDASKKYHTLSIPNRELSFYISLNPMFTSGKSYSELRDDLYRAISSSRSGVTQVRLNDSLTTIAAVSGFITSFETNHFDQSPTVKITVWCDDGLLKGLSPIIVDTTPWLEPYFTIVDSYSTAPHGFKFKSTFVDQPDSYVIQEDPASGWTFTITPGLIGGLTGFEVGDELYFSSEADNKYLYIIRSATTIHLLDKIVPGSSWPILFPGTNSFSTSLDTVTWDEVSYYPTYWGV